MVLIVFSSLGESVFVDPKFAREGVDSYLMWLPWCPRFPAASFDFQPLCLRVSGG